MDDALVTRWRQGDPNARPGVRNALRAVADRVLAYPGLHDALPPQEVAGFAREDRRRDRVTAIAKEVMERGATSAAQLTAMTLVVAGRTAIEALQRDRATGHDAHVPPQVAAAFAVAPDALSALMREAAERHLAGCGACERDIEVVRRAIREDEEAVAEVEALADIGVPGPEEIPEPAFLRAPPAAPAPTRPRSPAPRRRAPAARTSAPTPGPLRAALPVIGIAAGLGGAWWWMNRGEVDPVGVTRLASFADRAPPELVLDGEQAEDLSLAARELERGDCRSAAARLRAAGRSRPEDLRLPTWEAGAWVCAGDGARALAVLEEVRAKGGTPPRQASWLEANAALLEGDGPAALTALGRTVEEDPRHREAAAALSQQVRAVLWPTDG